MIDDDLSTYGLVYFDAGETWGWLEMQLPGYRYTYGVEIHAGFDLKGMEVNIEGEYCDLCDTGEKCSFKCRRTVEGDFVKVTLQKNLPVSYYETSWTIYEIKVKGGPTILSNEEIAGVVAGIVCALLFIIGFVKVFKHYQKLKKQHMEDFDRMLREGYASANARGERSGFFVIPHGHPDKYVKCTLDWRYDGGMREVIFSIRSPDGRYAYHGGYRHSCVVTFRIAGDAENAHNTNNVRNGRENAAEPTAPPSTSEIMNLPPPSYRVSNALRTHNFDDIDIPSYEEVIANSECYPEADE